MQQNNGGGFGNQGSRAAWVADIFNDTKLVLRAPPVQEGGWDARLRVKMRQNNPCIEINSGIKTSKGKIMKYDVPMAPRPFEQLMYMVERVAHSKVPVAFELENWGYQYRWNSSTNKSERDAEISVIARFSIAKDETGIVSLSVAVQNGKTVIRFPFAGDEYHRWMANGNYMEPGEVSKLEALSWATTWREVYIQSFVTKWEEPEWEKAKRIERMAQATGGGGGGGFQNRQNNQGGGGFQKQAQSPASSPMDSFEDDLPF